MKKIMIIANNDVGLYKFRKELIETLLKNYTVYIALPDGVFVNELVQLGCVFCPTEFSRHGTNPLSELRLLRHYKRLLKSIEPDVVLTYTIKPNIYGGIACASQKIPYVANITGLGTAVEKRGVLQLVTTTLYRFALRKAKKVFFQNEENLRFMKSRNIVKGNWDILPGSGVNLKHYKPFPYPNGETIDFVFVARVMKEKGIDQYLEAAEYIRNKYPSTRFHICGAYEDDYEETLKRMSAAGTIVYHGLVRDMLPIYEMSACTVHPTYYPEGMSNVLLESCASARPIIATDRAGCKEIIDNGINGYVCAPQNSDDLIEKIERFLALEYQERRRMGEQARIKVEKEFDREIVINKYLMEIEEIGLV